MIDIIKSSNVFDFSMCADDMGIDKNKLYDDTLKTELCKVIDWFSCNDLMLNVN